MNSLSSITTISWKICDNYCPTQETMLMILSLLNSPNVQQVNITGTKTAYSHTKARLCKNLCDPRTHRSYFCVSAVIVAKFVRTLSEIIGYIWTLRGPKACYWDRTPVCTISGPFRSCLGPEKVHLSATHINYVCFFKGKSHAVVP